MTDIGIAYPQPGGALNPVVNGVSFHVDRNEVVGIVGESGSGKSQTAFSVLGLLPDNAVITSGSIQFDGAYTVAPGDDHVSQSRLAPLRGKRIAYIPQEPMSNLDPAFTVGSQLARPMVRVLGISKAEANQRALDLLASVGIPGGDVRDILRTPQHPYTQMLLSSMLEGKEPMTPLLASTKEGTR